MLSKRIDAVLIDFYGTICAGDREAVEGTCKRIVKDCGLTLSPGDFAIRWGKRFFATIERSNHASFATLHECEISSLRETLQEFGVDSDPAPFVADLEAYWRNPPLYEDAVAFLGELDVPVCCVSNADTEPLMMAIERNGLRFDAIVSSEAAGCYKPDPMIFERAFAALGIGPERVLHVGDSLHSDIGGAASVGIESIWVERESRIHDIGHTGNCKSDYKVAVLTEILELT